MDNQNKEIPQSKRMLNCLAEWGKSFIVAGIIAFLIMKFVLFFAVIPTGSMIPTINEGSRVLVAKFYRYLDWENRGLKYGDIVVFDFKEATHGKEDKLLVKRVIGMGGDKIYIDNGVVYRNGKPLNEPYVKNKDSFFMDEFTVPYGEIFVLGDNRANSFDGRYWETQGYNKTIKMKDVLGEVMLKN